MNEIHTSCIYRKSCLNIPNVIQEDNMNFIQQPPGQRSKGGTAIAIRKEILHKRLTYRTILQVVAREVYLVGKDNNKLNISLPNRPSEGRRQRELLNQLTTPLILKGNIITYCPLQGSEKISTRKKMLEKIHDKYNLFCYKTCHKLVNAINFLKIETT